MKVLFISASCSKTKYQEVFNMRNKKLIDPQQKFCKLLIDGMSSVEGVEIECISAIPVSASTVCQRKFKEEIELPSPSLKYRYLGFTNGRVLRYLTLFVSSCRAVTRWIKENNGEQMFIVCDALSYFITRPAQLVALRSGISTIGIITDLPLLSTNMKGRKDSWIKRVGYALFQHLIEKSLKNYDAFIPLTKSIDEYVNKENKPMVIVEGSVDSNEKYSNENIIKKKVVLYAGGIYEKYGLKNLVEAFVDADTNGYELHIYGEGSYVEELIAVSKRDQKIKYLGMLTLDEIVKREKEASLLVNPRPSNEEFSKYSFPSKTLEYMTSRTPLLTTRLQGIPEEYFRYVYSFDGEDVSSMKQKIEEILNKSEEELQRKGQSGFEFVIMKKINCLQGARIIEFLAGLEDKNANYN